MALPDLPWKSFCRPYILWSLFSPATVWLPYGETSTGDPGEPTLLSSVELYCPYTVGPSDGGRDRHEFVCPPRRPHASGRARAGDPTFGWRCETMYDLSDSEARRAFAEPGGRESAPGKHEAQPAQPAIPDLQAPERAYGPQREARLPVRSLRGLRRWARVGVTHERWSEHHTAPTVSHVAVDRCRRA